MEQPESSLPHSQAPAICPFLHTCHMPRPSHSFLFYLPHNIGWGVRSGQTVFMCFVFIWEQTATCATYNINWLVFITEMKSVYCAVRTGSLTKAVFVSYLNYSKISHSLLKFYANSEIETFICDCVVLYRITWHTSLRISEKVASILFYEPCYVYQTKRCHTL